MSLLATTLGTTALTSGAVTAGAAAAPGDPAPSIHLFSTVDRIVVKRRGTRPARVDLPIFLGARNGTFDLRLKRSGYDSPIEVTQVIHDEAGNTTRALPDLEVTDWGGIAKFYRVIVTRPDGRTTSKARTFCPNAYQPQRIAPDGPDQPTFPEGCWAQPFALGSVWGVDQGWAAKVLEWSGVSLRGPNGRYEVTLKIKNRYAELLDVAPEDRSATVVVRVKQGRGGGGGHTHRVPARSSGPEPRSLPRRNVRTLDAAPPGAPLPDLRAMPAFDIGVRNGRKQSQLGFAANVYVQGDSLLDIEGFRRRGEDVMDAFQYFYDDKEVVGRAPVGTMEFDRRDGHHHWHLLQFARYRLLSIDQQHVVASGKQSFCIVPTDPVDISGEKAERRPWRTGLHSACGSEDALWIRETLPIGWGDTYYQSRAGQALNITNVPNGTYYLAVEANPTGELFESDTANNVSLREVRLMGGPGNRRVCVPGVFGIDAWNPCS